MVAPVSSDGIILASSSSTFSSVTSLTEDSSSSSVTAPTALRTSTLRALILLRRSMEHSSAGRAGGRAWGAARARQAAGAAEEVRATAPLLTCSSTTLERLNVPDPIGTRASANVTSLGSCDARGGAGRGVSSTESVTLRVERARAAGQTPGRARRGRRAPAAKSARPEMCHCPRASGNPRGRRMQSAGARSQACAPRSLARCRRRRRRRRRARRRRQPRALRASPKGRRKGLAWMASEQPWEGTA